ncbi:hypothetical protein WKW79_20505 [Variovorax robiniae]|uniref:Uncharacterized protein n=1 Tax=Variovorax robiniae TaxID=1836199 RepID=A0ABU8XD39_9BURK
MATVATRFGPMSDTSPAYATLTALDNLSTSLDTLLPLIAADGFNKATARTQAAAILAALPVSGAAAIPNGVSIVHPVREVLNRFIAVMDNASADPTQIRAVALAYRGVAGVQRDAANLLSTGVA